MNKNLISHKNCLLSFENYSYNFLNKVIIFKYLYICIQNNAKKNDGEVRNYCNHRSSF